ncbi:MAG TPA: L,D-transpeptidase [Vicinamibacterales bacterium]|jgi:lipoprotein-anchoring transpeptidase ErfK/SrfK|nr:L,D-transpeptidase [Vicinamibacterales bacterium]
MRANRAMWMAAALMAVGMNGRADAADTANEVVVRRLVVSIPDRKLAVIENNEVVEVFTVAVGAPNSPSPTGTFTIVNRVANPTYYHPGKVIAPGPQNPIGTRWIGLNQKGYGIHGTDQPSSIGYAKSHGCIRLRNADVERLFERVRTGDVVELHAERTPELDQLFPSTY